MGSRIFKILASLSLIAIGFFAYSYFWGSMYGGRKYDKDSFAAEARVLLSRYKSDQDAFFKVTGKYSHDMHFSSSYAEYSNFKLGFADSDPVSRFCPGCNFAEGKYQIAAFGTFEGQDVVWSIDSDGNVAAQKE